MCIIEDFYPKNNLSVQWKINDTNSMSQLNLESKLNNQGYFKGYSFYEVSSENWDVNTQYTCEVTHQGGQFHSKANFKSKSSNVDLLPLVHTLTSFSNSHKDTLLQTDLNSQIYTHIIYLYHR